MSVMPDDVCRNCEVRQQKIDLLEQKLADFTQLANLRLTAAQDEFAADWHKYLKQEKPKLFEQLNDGIAHCRQMAKTAVYLLKLEEATGKKRKQIAADLTRVLPRNVTGQMLANYLNPDESSCPSDIDAALRKLVLKEFSHDFCVMQVRVAQSYFVPWIHYRVREPEERIGLPLAQIAAEEVALLEAAIFRGWMPGANVQEFIKSHPQLDIPALRDDALTWTATLLDKFGADVLLMFYTLEREAVSREKNRRPMFKRLLYGN